MTYSHVVVVMIVQGLLGLLTGNWWYGVVFSSFYIGREITQAEYRWIEKFGNGLRRNMPWWGPFDLKVWDKADQFLDCITPLIISVVIALLLS